MTDSRSRDEHSSNQFPRRRHRGRARFPSRFGTSSWIRPSRRFGPRRPRRSLWSGPAGGGNSPRASGRPTPDEAARTSRRRYRLIYPVLPRHPGFPIGEGESTGTSTTNDGPLFPASALRPPMRNGPDLHPGGRSVGRRSYRHSSSSRGGRLRYPATSRPGVLEATFRLPDERQPVRSPKLNEDRWPLGKHLILDTP